MSLLVVVAMMGSTAAAKDVEWCDDDPIFKVLGSHFRVTASVAAPAAQVSAVQYAVTLPSDAQGKTSVHFTQQHKVPATVSIRYDGPAAGDGATFPVTVVITVVGPSGAAVMADLAGPDVQATSVSGTTGSAVTLSFDVRAR